MLIKSQMAPYGYDEELFFQKERGEIPKADKNSIFLHFRNLELNYFF